MEGGTGTPMSTVERGTTRQNAAARYRNARSHRAILVATNELLAESGYTALTIEGVAARARVGKATVYRWWPSKGALVIEAITHDGRMTLPTADTGQLRDDLIYAVHHVIEVLTDSTAGSIIPAMTADLVRDPTIAKMFREQVLRPRRSAVAAMINRAIDRGELPPDADVALLLDVCVGAVFYRLIVSGEPITETFAARLIDLLLHGALAAT